MASKWTWIVGSTICCTGLLGICLLTSLNPARRSDQQIREELLASTPIGSDETVVDRYAKSHFAQDNFFNWHETETGKSLNVLYGSYQTWRNFPFATCVRVVWKFDNKQKLSEISLFRWTDSI